MPTACVVAHPAHELRCFHWLELNRPTLFVLTDGSGGSGGPRVAMSQALLDSTGGRRGSIFGDLSDRDAYRLIMERDSDGLERLLQTLSEALVQLDPAVIVGDACEGYNPVHDLCRVLINAACVLLGITDAERNLAMRLTGRPTETLGSMVLNLDAAALSRKIAAAERYTAVDNEVRASLRDCGHEAFAVEVFEPQRPNRPVRVVQPPSYETFGRARVTQGLYREALTYDHFRAAADVIDSYAARRG